MGALGLERTTTDAVARVSPQGDDCSLESLLERYEPIIVAEARATLTRYGRGLGSQCADDLEQEGRIALLALARAYEPRPDVPFGAYIRSKLRWTLYNYLRRERKRTLATTGLDNPRTALVCAELRAGGGTGPDNPRLRSAFARLTPRQRRVVELHYWREKNLGEIATELGITRQAATALSQRALARLRKEMGRKA